MCTLCSAKYEHKQTLIKHERKYHNIEKPSLLVERKCPICKFITRRPKRHNEENIYSHFENVHGIFMKFERHSFDSVNEFNVWKQEIEKKTSFVKQKSNGNVSVYQCHRSGFYRKRGVNKRHIKIMGTSKINAFCPAMIKVKKLKNDTLHVSYLSTHAVSYTHLRCNWFSFFMYLNLTFKSWCCWITFQ